MVSMVDVVTAEMPIMVKTVSIKRARIIADPLSLLICFMPVLVLMIFKM